MFLHICFSNHRSPVICSSECFAVAYCIISWTEQENGLSLLLGQEPAQPIRIKVFLGP